MKWTRRMLFAVVWAIILVVSTLAAPISQLHPKDSTNQQTEAQATDNDVTAKELASLSQNAESQPMSPSAQEALAHPPAVQSQNAEQETPQAAPQNSDPKPVEASEKDQSAEEPDVISAPLNSLPAKRIYPTFDNNVFPDPRSFASFPQRVEEAPQFEGPADYPSLQPEMDNSIYSEEPQIDLSPRAVAEYLLVTKDFDGLEQALSDLVQSGVLSPNEVFQYKETVSVNYNDLLRRVETPEFAQNVNPLEYLERQGQTYPEDILNRNSLPVQKMGYAADFGIPASDFGQYQAIPIAERRTERVQKLLLAKQQTLDGILDVVLNDYYNRPQEEYIPENVEPINPASGLEEDTDLEELMEYLQEAAQQDREEDYDQSAFAPAQMVVPQNGAKEVDSVPESPQPETSSEAEVKNEVENELDSLPKQREETNASEETDSQDQTSGDEEEKMVNDTKSKAIESS